MAGKKELPQQQDRPRAQPAHRYGIRALRHRSRARSGRGRCIGGSFRSRGSPGGYGSYGSFGSSRALRPSGSHGACTGAPSGPPILEVARTNNEALEATIQSALEDALQEELVQEEEAEAPPSPLTQPELAEPLPDLPSGTSPAGVPAAILELGSWSTPMADAPPIPAEASALQPEEAPPPSASDGEEFSQSLPYYYPLPDGARFVNVMPPLVEETLERYVRLFHLCDCPRCLADAKALPSPACRPNMWSFRSTPSPHDEPLPRQIRLHGHDAGGIRLQADHRYPPAPGKALSAPQPVPPPICHEGLSKSRVKLQKTISPGFFMSQFVSVEESSSRFVGRRPPSQRRRSSHDGSVLCAVPQSARACSSKTR